MKIFKRILLIFCLVVASIGLITFLFMQQASFGKRPSGARLHRIKQSKNYVNGNFVNRSETPALAEDASYVQLLKAYLNSNEKTEPDTLIPSVRRDLKETPSEAPTLTWFGHSSLLIQADGKNVLVDPMFSERASPVQYAGSKSYPGTRVYAIEDFPKIHYVFITHDHYDHLDYGTIQKLRAQVDTFYTPLGIGSHLEAWGIDPAKIVELDWWENTDITPSLTLTATPARHFSGRGLTDRNQTLWASYVLQTSHHRIYIGGDSGYDTHYKEIGEKFGPFDLVLLESGQYHPYWPYIHMMPEQTVQAAIDLQAKVLLPVHWGKFTLALHAWDEPIKRVSKEAAQRNVTLTTPILGEKVILDETYPNTQWWLPKASL